MSQYFYVGDKIVWNPSNGVGQLFLRFAEALAPTAGLPTGISPADHIADADVWAVDMPVFEAFVDALVDRYQRSTHPIMRSLLEGFAAVPSLGKESGRAPAGSLAELRALHARSMPD
jgi:Family of unknown function (DUF6086)